MGKIKLAEISEKEIIALWECINDLRACFENIIELIEEDIADIRLDSCHRMLNEIAKQYNRWL